MLEEIQISDLLDKKLKTKQKICPKYAQRTE